MIRKTGLAHLQPTERKALDEFVQLIQEQFNGLVQLILLFGSKARGDDTLDSDVDILVVVDSDDWRVHKQVRYLAADMSLKYNLDLSPRVWSISHLHKMEEIDASLYRNIQQDALNLLEQTMLA